VTETESKWAERVGQWRVSGKTAREFAAGQGFEASTLRYWASQLNRRRPGKPIALSAPAAVVARVRMVRVRRKPRAASAEAMVVWIGAACIELRAGFDRGLLREVVDALGAKP
jgi:hypothetical protein